VEVSLEKLTGLVPGQIVGTYGYPCINGVNSLKAATETEVSFLGNKKYLPQVAQSTAGIIILPEDYNGLPRPGQAFIKTQNPSQAFSIVAGLFAPMAIVYDQGIHPSAVIHPTAKVSPSACIQPNAVIGEYSVIGDHTVIGANCYVGAFTQIGENCLIYSNVSIRERCKVGNHAVIHSGVVVGSDGFGFDLQSANSKVPQTGIVQIDDHVEIGANTTIDRARFGRTWIQSGVKIDNLVQIGHNVVVKKNTIIVAQVGISGSTVIGENVIIAGQVGIIGHIEIGDGAIVAAQSGVSKDVPPKRIWSSQFHAREMKDFYQMEASMKRLPVLRKKVLELEAKLKQLEAKFPASDS